MSLEAASAAAREFLSHAPLDEIDEATAVWSKFGTLGDLGVRTSSGDRYVLHGGVVYRTSSLPDGREEVRMYQHGKVLGVKAVVGRTVPDLN